MSYKSPDDISIFNTIKTDDLLVTGNVAFQSRVSYEGDLVVPGSLTVSHVNIPGGTLATSIDISNTRDYVDQQITHAFTSELSNNTFLSSTLENGVRSIIDNSYSVTSIIQEVLFDVSGVESRIDVNEANISNLDASVNTAYDRIHTLDVSALDLYNIKFNKAGGSIGGNTSISGNLYVVNKLAIGSTDLNATLDISGDSKFRGDVNVAEGNDLIVTGNATVNETLRVDGSMNVDGSLNVNNDVSLSGVLYIGGENIVDTIQTAIDDLSGSVATDIQNLNSTITGTINTQIQDLSNVKFDKEGGDISGDVTITDQHNLTVTGDVIVEQELDVSGSVTFRDGLDMSFTQIVNVRDPNNTQDATTKGYVDVSLGLLDISLKQYTDASIITLTGIVDASLDALETSLKQYTDASIVTLTGIVDASLDALETSLKQYTDASIVTLTGIVDASLDALETSLKQYTDASIVTLTGIVDASLDALETSLKQYTDNSINLLKGYVDGSLGLLDASLQTYTDNSINLLRTYVDGSLSLLDASLQTYTDNSINLLRTYVDGSLGLLDASLQTYTDNSITTLTGIVDASLDALDASLQSYTDNSIVTLTGIVDVSLDALETSLKQYTDAYIVTLTGIVDVSLDALETSLKQYTDASIVTLTGIVDVSLDALETSLKQYTDNSINTLTGIVDVSLDALDTSLKSYTDGSINSLKDYVDDLSTNHYTLDTSLKSYTDGSINSLKDYVDTSLNNKFDKSGGNISGDVTITNQHNLTVTGDASINGILYVGDNGDEISMIKLNRASPDGGDSAMIITRGYAQNSSSDTRLGRTELLIFQPGDLESSNWGPDRIRLKSTNILFDTNSSNNELTYTPENTKMIILEDGKVGIGTTTPSQTLDVNGTVNATTFNEGGTNLASLYAAINGNSSQSFNASTLTLTNSSSTGTISTNYSTSETQFELTDNSQTLTFSTGNTPYIGTKTDHSLRFITNNTERMRVTNTGRLGIGTTTPGYKLDVDGDVKIRGSYFNIGDSVIVENNTSAPTSFPNTSYKRIAIGGGNSTGYIFGAFNGLGDGIYLSYNYVNYNGTNNNYIRQTGSGSGTSLIGLKYGEIQFATNTSGSNNPSTRMVITQNGNVGINKTSPGYTLDVDGSINATTIYESGSTLADTYAAIGGSSSNTFTVANASSNSHAVNRSYADSRYVNVGGDTITGDLNISNTASLYLGNQVRQMINLYSTGYGIGVQSSTTYFRSDNHFAFYKGGSHNDNALNAGGGTALMLIKNTGNVGIGLTDPGKSIDVSGSIRIRDVRDGYGKDHEHSLQFNNGYYTTAYIGHTSRMTVHNGNYEGGLDFYARYNGTSFKHIMTAGWFENNERVGIGTPDPSGTLHVQGDIVINNTGNTNYWRIVSNEDNNQVDDLHFKVGTSSKGFIQDDANVSQIDFTGQHHNYSVNEDIDADLKGFIVVSTGTYRNQMNHCNECNKYKITINESLPIVDLSKKSNDKKVFGVISDKDDYGTSCEYKAGAFVSVYEQHKLDRPLTINSLGEGAIWVCNVNGVIENGDYITSSPIPGLGMIQNDDLLHNYTVAKSTMDCEFVGEQVPRKKLRQTPVMIEKTESKLIQQTDESGNLVTDESGNPVIIEEKDASGNIIKVTVYDESGNPIMVQDRYSNGELKYDPVVDEQGNFIYDFIYDDSGNQLYTDKYESKYVEVFADKFVIYNDEEKTQEFYTYEFDFANGSQDQQDCIGNTYVMAFIGCTYHCG
jgi:hypothetical protein